MADLMMPVLVLLLAYRRDIKLSSFEAYPRVDNAVSSIAYKGGNSLVLLWITKRPPVLALPRLIQEVPDLALPLTPEVLVLTHLRLTEMVNVLALLRLTQEVPAPARMQLT